MSKYTAHTLCEFALATPHCALLNELHSLSAEMRLKSLMKSDTFVVSTFLHILFCGPDNNTEHA